MNRREFLGLLPVTAVLPWGQDSTVSFERIDAHFHMHHGGPAMVSGLQRSRWKALSICVCGGIATEPYDLEEELHGTASLHQSSNGRIGWVATFDARTFQDRDFVDRITASLNRSFEQGAIGVKIWKNIGMAIRSASGAYLMPDDPALLLIYAAIEKADRTLFVHVADPSGAWMPRPAIPTGISPAGGTTPDWWRMYGRPGAPANWWNLAGRSGAPTRRELLESRDSILRRFPRLRVVGVHLGSDEDDLQALAARLDTYPNFAVDVAARVGRLARMPTATVQEFLLKYQDRVQYGSDVLIPDGMGDEDGWNHLRVVLDREWNFFAGSGVVRLGATSTSSTSLDVQGLALPEKVLRKIFHDNSRRWIPGI